MGKRAVKLREFPPPEKAEHIKLVRGIYSCNPHPKVLCPTLIETGSCKKKGKGRKGFSRARPKFLIRNFNDSSLELWECSGCKDFLLRVELQK